MAKKITQEEFDEILGDIVAEEGANILGIGDVYSILAEHYNNTVLEIWEEKQIEDHQRRAFENDPPLDGEYNQ